MIRNPRALALLIACLALPPVLAAESTPSPEQVLKQLKEGNERYLTNVSKHARIDVERRVETAKKGQKPLSTVLGCSDSRVPVEIVFDQGFAEVFVVRVAGNICDTAELASVEYGTRYLGTPLLVVLGHSKCGAVDGAVSGARLEGSLPKLVAHITPAERARPQGPAQGGRRRSRPEERPRALAGRAPAPEEPDRKNLIGPT
jgi:carbonic anhydrase